MQTSQSLKRPALDPLAYLKYVIARLSDHPMDRLDELLPDQWKLLHLPEATSFSAASDPAPRSRMLGLGSHWSLQTPPPPRTRPPRGHAASGIRCLGHFPPQPEKTLALKRTARHDSFVLCVR
jgi:hypothetical protein